MSPDPANGAGAGAKEKPKPRERKPALEPAVRELLETVAGILALKGDAYPAEILETNAAQLASAYARLAKRNKAVRRILEALTSGGDYGEAVMVTLATLVPIAVFYGWLPTDSPLPMFGAPPPPSREVRDHAAKPPPAPVKPPAGGGPGDVPLAGPVDESRVTEAKPPPPKKPRAHGDGKSGSAG
jgi:hypothetical protein